MGWLFAAVVAFGAIVYGAIATGFGGGSSSESDVDDPSSRGQTPELDAPPLEVQGQGNGQGQGGSGQGGSGSGGNGDGATGNTIGRVVGQEGGPQNTSADQANPPLTRVQALEQLLNMHDILTREREEAVQSGADPQLIDQVDQEIQALEDQINDITAQELWSRLQDVQEHVADILDQTGEPQPGTSGTQSQSPTPGTSGTQQQPTTTTNAPDQRPEGGGPMRGQGQDGGQVGPRQNRVPAGTGPERRRALRQMGYSAAEANRYVDWREGRLLPDPGNPPPRGRINWQGTYQG